MTIEIDAAGRRLIHKRDIECRGFLRADGLWDIEGRMADVKTHPVPLSEGLTVEAGQIYHGMVIKVTVDDEFMIRTIAVSMPNVPTSECRGAIPGYERLVGVRIGAGFSRRVKDLFGGIRGCVHLTELLLPIATTAFQTIPMARSMVAPRKRECPDFCVRGAGCRTYPCSCSLVVNVLALQGQGHVIHMSGQLGG